MSSVTVKNVCKIFGDDPEAALKMLDQGKTKEDVQNETGQVVGVYNVNFRIESGQLFVIMGLSGSGKSTLLRCINRLVEPTRGDIKVEVNGEDYNIPTLNKRELRRMREQNISMIFQHFALFPFRTVLSNVTFGLEIQGIDRKTRKKKGMEVLEMVGLEAWAESRPAQLSGGMQQRVGLARALASDADLLLMDEPFSALDPLIKVNMQDELLNLQKKVHRTIFFVSHDLDEALKLGDRIAIMESGRIIQLGTPEDIIVNPRTEYVANFVEHADATGVLTAKQIVKSVELRHEKPEELMGVNAPEVRGSVFARVNGCIFALDGDGRPLMGISDEKIMSIKHLGEPIPEDSNQTKYLLAASEDSFLRDIMRERLDIPYNPVLILSKSGALKGVLTEREILKGILEKGRSEIDEESN